MAGQAAFQVGGFVAVDVAAFGQFVDHADDFGQVALGFRLVLQVAQVLDRGARSFFVVTVLQAAFINLTNTLECRTVVCHIMSR